MKKTRKTRISKKDREEAARLAKETGVRVTIGKFTFDPPAAANDEADRTADAIERMSKRPSTARS